MGFGAMAFESLVLVVLSTMLVSPADAIECYQCVSTNNVHPFQCNEYLSSDIDMVPESCDAVFEAQYCVKHVGRFKDGVGTKRFCSAVHMGNYCEYVRFAGDELEYRTCVYTCDGDGCNPATKSKPNFIVAGVLMLSVLAYRR